MSGGITVAYSGVHQAYQLALAAHELGVLDLFLCSVYAAPGKWGGWLEKFVPEGTLFSRHAEGLDPGKIREFPWPLVWQRVRSRLLPGSSNDWLLANDWFDRHAAKALEGAGTSVCVGAETCALHSLAAAKRLGMKTVLDCPGVDSEFLNEIAAKAAGQFGLRTVSQADPAAMGRRKDEELKLADAVLVCSAFQAETMQRRKIPPEQLVIAPLWVDGGFWHPDVDAIRSNGDRRLRVLFAGKINVRKGVPYLLEAARSCAQQLRVTLVGRVDADVAPLIGQRPPNVSVLAPRPKRDLRDLYRQHDLLVLPSLGDSFGFVALEAMACGLPVIVTENCGVPVPDESWRVPVMDADAIAERLLLYARDRELCREHGRVAAEFARQYTPERYREQIKDLYRRLLGETAPAAVSPLRPDA